MKNDIVIGVLLQTLYLEKLSKMLSVNQIAEVFKLKYLGQSFCRISNFWLVSVSLHCGCFIFSFERY